MKKLIPALIGLIMVANSGCAYLAKPQNPDYYKINYPREYKITEEALNQFDYDFRIQKLAAIAGFSNGSLELELGNPETHLVVRVKLNTSLDKITIDDIDLRKDKVIEGFEVSFACELLSPKGLSVALNQLVEFSK